MPQFYSPLAASSTLQIPTSQVAVDAVASTVTASSGITATLVLPAEWFTDTRGADRLEVFANALNEIWVSGMIAGGIGGQAPDANGLVQDVVDFTVCYPKNSRSNARYTKLVQVPCKDIGGDGLGTGHIGSDFALTLITAAYDQLAAQAAT